MNGFLAANIEPGWATLAFTIIAGIVVVLFRYWGDSRWQKKPDAEQQAAAHKEELAREVKALQATDAEVKAAIQNLEETVKNQDMTARADMTSLRGEMNKGFKELSEAVATGILSLTREVGIIQGRLAGANGVPKAE